MGVFQYHGLHHKHHHHCCEHYAYEDVSKDLQHEITCQAVLEAPSGSVVQCFDEDKGDEYEVVEALAGFDQEELVVYTDEMSRRKGSHL